MGTAYSLAGVLSEQENHAEAIPLRRRELAWCRQQYGDTDHSTLTSINQLAIDLRETGELEEAEILFRELVASQVDVMDSKDFQIGRALCGLSKTLEQAGKLEDALDYAQQCLAHRLEHEGKDSWYTNNNRLDLARVLYKLSRFAQALALLDELQISVGENKETDDNDRQLLANSAELRQLMKTS
jgi:tetratricopeptide (TPR) repeat protein